MKKLIALFLALVCVLFLISCSLQWQQETTNTTNTPTSYLYIDMLAEQDITVLTAWFDSEGFVPVISQSKMFEKMDSYKYNGKSIKAATVGFYYDGLYGGGYQANGEDFGFENDYTVSKDEKTAVYTNSFYTKVPLDGLTLPFEIEFYDTLKFSDNFTPDGDADNAMTIYKDERYTVIFMDLTLSKEPITTDTPYELIFMENYTFTRGDGRVSNVTRTIKLAFTSDEKVLHKFNLEIKESYNLN